MAMLASKSPFPTVITTSGLPSGGNPPSALPTSRRIAVTPASAQHHGGAPGSPAGSDFSDLDGPDSVRNWDEDRVCDYLNTINCGDYQAIFRKNHINGENLLEMDKDVLKEMGIDKVGDRVRLFLGIKKLRTKACANQKKRNRDSFGALEIQVKPPQTSSPRNQTFRPGHAAPLFNKRFSRQLDMSAYDMSAYDLSKPTSSRPTSPIQETDPRGARQQQQQQQQQRYPQGAGYFTANPPPRHQQTPSDPQSSARLAHTRNNSSVDGSLMAALPHNQDVIRVISTDGVTKVVKIAGCNTCEEVMRVTLRKFTLREDHERNYCFWVLTGTEPDPNHCKRLGDTELWRIIKDQRRPERNRLILRRVPAGSPGSQELQRAAAIAMEEEQQKYSRALETVDKRGQAKVQKVLGERWGDKLQQPLSPASYSDRQRNVSNAAKDLERPPSSDSSAPQRRKVGSLRQFGGLRPPSELIACDLTSYFPDHAREDIDRTARLSMRRSTRLSKVNSRLSVASNLSFASSIQDAPPIPTIADSWLHGGGQVAKVHGRDSQGRLPQMFNRDSFASSMLDTLQEESTAMEPDRKSYVSFTESSSDGATPVSVTDPDGNTAAGSFFDTDGSTQSGDEAKQFLTQTFEIDHNLRPSADDLMLSDFLAP
ncbi:hypothetical protein GMORB2_6754, partial [Geosmithia morbida]